ncbi:DUF294 nucleotidyltransferase-like domain-containing protein [Paucibacter sp. KCTC 42545]|uniref:DUF294 nucleotidyltransferase-like domain-containing protein n=1 Tax=Paucibacter sp. KCTC 42545 TaxID=1768242 RepID=UPI000733A9E5|nr:DUF294 nucleotidyltransferase-like domain-containing protein [Paucibacter sp. KCTC 42545]ALT77818.1 cyclic nucleotide-binding protein [Paucibacter sp. KCTC 42545]
MPNAFNFNTSPFDCLSLAERQLVRDQLDIAYFRPGDVLLAPGVVPEHLFIIIKGFVQQFEGVGGGEEHVATFGPEDTFDGRALVAGKVSGRFVAAQEVLAYQLARGAVNELISSNATFSAMLFADLSKKISALAARGSQHEMQSLGLARVAQAGVRAVHQLPADTDIVSVARCFAEQRCDHVLVQDAQTEPPRIGLFSSNDLQRAILDGRPLDRLAVGELASFKLVWVAETDYLFDALITMIRHKVRRVVVRQTDAPDARILGTLDQLDLLSFLTNHSYLITRQIQEAQGLEALRLAAEQINALIALLYRGGTKINLIARLVQELNAQLFERAWQLIAPADLQANSCLFVMGSEGRGEQLLKTDQDNGLVLRDGYTPPVNLAEICTRFSQALADFGYPECPGGIMLSRPDWRHSATEFAQTVRRWLLMPTADSLMALAIFIDAHAVAGDAILLETLRAEVFKQVLDNDALLARFCAVINAFEQGQGWWNKLLHLGDSHGQQLDLKRAGTFPLVHGVRSLALAHRVTATSTVARIEALAAQDHLPADLATDLIDSLHFFMGLKLKTGLAALEQGQQGGGIALDQLSSQDRHLLKDTLGVVKRLRALLHLRFRLDML